MEFTKEELEWIETTRKERKQIGNIVEELNQRTRAYIGYQQRNIEQAQEQALIDFQYFDKPKDLVATTTKTDFDNHIYFKVS